MNSLEIALTAILINRLRSALTMLGIIIGVMSVIVLVAVVSGLNSYITSQIQGLGSNLLFVIPGRVGGARTAGGVQTNKLLTLDATNLRNGLGSLAQVSGVVQTITTIKFHSKTDTDASVLGVQANYPQLISVTLTQGRFFTQSEVDSGRRVAIIGATVQNNLFGNFPSAGFNVNVGGLNYQVIGVLATRGSAFGVDQDNEIVVPLPAAQKQFGITNLNAIYISADKPSDVSLVQRRATAILLKRLTVDDFTISTQAQTLSTISQITNVLTLALGGIAAISLLVGGIGIMNIMLVSVTERTREIGLRKAMGAKPAEIRNQFLIEAVTLSGLGGIVGIILGILVSLLIGRFLTTDVTWWSVALSFGFSTLVGVVFGVIPAIRAARLDPIQALRYE